MALWASCFILLLFQNCAPETAGNGPQTHPYRDLARGAGTTGVPDRLQWIQWSGGELGPHEQQMPSWASFIPSFLETEFFLNFNRSSCI